jgi:hypothetical protein
LKCNIVAFSEGDFFFVYDVVFVYATTCNLEKDESEKESNKKEYNHVNDTIHHPLLQFVSPPLEFGIQL